MKRSILVLTPLFLAASMMGQPISGQQMQPWLTRAATTLARAGTAMKLC